MRYDVLKDFEDDVHKVDKYSGDIFIPAETNFPADAVSRLVASKTIRLIEPPAPALPAERPLDPRFHPAA